jgi:hypothetical protein
MVGSLEVGKEAASVSRQASGNNRLPTHEQMKGPAADGVSFLPRPQIWIAEVPLPSACKYNPGTHGSFRQNARRSGSSVWSEAGPSSRRSSAPPPSAPVIAFRRISVPEVGEHGVTGFFVDDEDKDVVRLDGRSYVCD